MEVHTAGRYKQECSVLQPFCRDEVYQHNDMWLDNFLHYSQGESMQTGAVYSRRGKLAQARQPKGKSCIMRRAVALDAIAFKCRHWRLGTVWRGMC